MKTTNETHRSLCRKLAFLGLVGSFAVPSISTATAPLSDSATPIAAADDDSDCEQAIIALEVDVTTGTVYIIDATGSITLTDNDITVYFGSLDQVLIDIQYSTSEWDVEISPSSQPVETLQTRGGALRYWINAENEEYVISSDVIGVTAMMNMTPIIPDIILKPKKDCPPPP